MPFYGLIPDSPFIYAAQKAASPRRNGGGGRAPMGFGFTFDKLIIYKPVLNYELNNPNSSMVGQYMSVRGKKIVLGAKAQVGYKTGQLRRSIHMTRGQQSNGQSFTIGSPLPYAYLHHEGTKPHIIRPKNNGVLAFKKGARVITSREVMHPGTRANKYLTTQLRIHIR